MDTSEKPRINLPGGSCAVCGANGLMGGVNDLAARSNDLKVWSGVEWGRVEGIIAVTTIDEGLKSLCEVGLFNIGDD